VPVQAPADQLAGDETSRRAVNPVNPLLRIEPQIPRLNGIRAQEPETFLCRVAPAHDVHDSAIATTRRDRGRQYLRYTAGLIIRSPVRITREMITEDPDLNWLISIAIRSKVGTECTINRRCSFLPAEQLYYLSTGPELPRRQTRDIRYTGRQNLDIQIFREIAETRLNSCQIARRLVG
jgi:hypothetical protein